MEATPRRYSSEQRAEALELARELGSVKEAAQQLGIPPHTVYAWRKPRVGRRRPLLERVQIVSADSSREGLSVLGPSGLRVDTITIEQLAALWRLLA